MIDDLQVQLEQVGLSATEALIYLMLLRQGGRIGASIIATSTGMARSTVYPALNQLTNLGLVETEAGYGSGFSAVPPDKSLPNFILRATEELAQRKRLVGALVQQLTPLTDASETNGEAEVIQVLRDPRVIGERFERLQQEAEQRVELFVKAPIHNPRSDNPTEEKNLRRGVRYRCLYERAIVDTPAVAPHFAKWLAQGEEARVHEGALPHKLAIFDRKNILMPLVTPSGQGRTLFIRNPEVASTLGVAFDCLWERAQPVPVETPGAGKAAPQPRAKRTPTNLPTP